ncbi:MAG: signal peptidase II [Sphaerochaetaceae bacterium]|nr:signal peptidase II [Sphaerochaetaceae bacterium]
MKERTRPLLLSLLIIIVDQLTKQLVVMTIPENSIGFSCLGDFLRIIHVRNTAVAFSLGTGLDEAVKVIFFILLPLAVMILLLFIILSDRARMEITEVQRWALAGILGGGCGNLIDRIFRNFRVVDFISNKFYGLFGFDRWPTYNIADSAVVISVFILAITILFERKGSAK